MTTTLEPLNVIPQPPNPVARGMYGPLGCGVHRVFVYDRGGEHRLGEITPIASVTWSRVRDDISNASVTTAGFGPDCCRLMESLHAMRHELVIFRDDVRVWEGPITLLTYQADSVSIEAHDVFYYLFRRAIENGYNDGYPNLKTVVARSVLICQDELARDDPNVAAYLTRFDRPDDAQEARAVQAYQKTVYEEIDDMAANAGLDYTTVGRRIMFWDTHNVIGRLSVFDDAAFLGNPIISEYGSSLCTTSIVSDGQGNFGTAGGEDFFYGCVEMIFSSYSSAGPPLQAGELTTINQNRVKAEAAYRTARAAYLRYPGLSAAEENQLAAWVTERNTPGVSPARQRWLDAHIKPLQDRHNKKQALLTQMNHAYTAFQNALQAQQAAAAKWNAYIAGLRSQALRNLHGRNPTPIVVRVPDNSQLNPNLDIGINQLVPGAWIPLRSSATCRQMTQWQKLDNVTVTQDASGEKVQITMSPAPDHGQDPVDVTTDASA